MLVSIDQDIGVFIYFVCDRISTTPEKEENRIRIIEGYVDKRILYRFHDDFLMNLMANNGADYNVLLIHGSRKACIGSERCFMVHVLVSVSLTSSTNEPFLNS